MLSDTVIAEQGGPYPTAAAHSTEAAPAPVLLQYWQVVLRRKWILFGIVAAALVAALVITLLMTPQYSATTRVEIAREQKNVTNVEGLETRDPRGDLEFYETQYALLEARSLAVRVMRKLRLSDSEDFFAAHGMEIPTSDRVGGAQLTRDIREERQEAAVDALLRHVNISPLPGSALVDITYTSGSPELSARIANEWAAQYIEATIARRFASTSDARRFLEGQLTDLRAKLEQSERDLVNYASDKNIVALTSSDDSEDSRVRRTLVETNLSNLNAALNQAIADRVAAQTRMNAVAAREQTANPVLTDLRQRRAVAAAEYARLMTQFEPAYPAARALKDQIDSLDASIASETSQSVSRARAEYQSAQARENQLRGQVRALTGQFDEQQRNQIQYNIYAREADTNQQLYQALLQRYKEIGVAGVEVTNIAVVDSAEVPDSPSSPNLALNLALALLIGGGLGIALVLALEQIDEGLRTPDQAKREIDLPYLGSVPDVGDTEPVEAMADVKSPLFESYIAVRSNLAFSTDHGLPRSIMVTSTRAAEGKSITSLSLATVIARTGKRVLLIDTDMRSPSVHEYFGGRNAKGLSNFLAGEEDLEGLIQRGRPDELDYLPAGPQPPSASELLSGPRLAQVIDKAGQSYDIVICDAPPVLNLADSPLIANAVEGVVYVAEIEGVPVRGIKSAIDRLRSTNVHFFGLVLTKLGERSAGYGYGYGSGYGYGQDREAQPDAA